MAIHHPHSDNRPRTAAAVFTAVFVMLIVSAAGAADRVVLGEYFTNLF